MLKIAGYPFSVLYGGLMRMRNTAFDLGLRSIHRPSVPVISVGNITAGGTGKTPITIFLAKYLVRKSKKVAVVSRGYGRKTHGELEVQLQENAPADFGDEPVLIKSEVPEARVFVGKRRDHLVTEIMGQMPFDVVIADDAFQHRQLHRNLDIVAFDALAPLADYVLLPVGKLREPLVCLARAQIIVVNRCNLAEGSHLQQLRQLIDDHRSRPAKVFFADMRLANICDLQGDTKDLRSCLLVSGVGRPAGVEAILKGKVEILSHLVFADHHDYSTVDLQKILCVFKNSKAEAVVTTAKDAVKLRAFTDLRPYLCVIETEISLDDEPGFYAAVDQVIV